MARLTNDNPTLAMATAHRGKPPTSDARAFFKVIPDLLENDSWTLVRNQRVIRRMDSKSALVKEARKIARERGNSVLEIRRSDGTFGGYSRYE